jgi:hypothetical protein
MRSSVIVIVAAALSVGAANAQRVVAATEGIAGDPNNPTSATDSGHGAVCTTANEDQTACFGTAYDVNSNLISAGFRAAGGTFGVNLCDVLGATCALAGTDPNNTISDQLYLQVGAQNVAANTNSITWCWDSDLENGSVNICQNQINVANPIQVLEPASGPTDLTLLFTGPGGPLAAGAWQVQATSDVPEPSAVLLLGSCLAAFAVWAYRKRKQVA